MESSGTEMGNRIKELRVSLGLTQRVFAEKLDISQSTLSQVEKGRVAVARTLVLAIAFLFNARLEWLLNGEGTSFIIPDKHIGIPYFENTISSEPSTYVVLPQLYDLQTENMIAFRCNQARNIYNQSIDVILPGDILIARPFYTNEQQNGVLVAGILNNSNIFSIGRVSNNIVNIFDEEHNELNINLTSSVYKIVGRVIRVIRETALY